MISPLPRRTKTPLFSRERRRSRQACIAWLVCACILILTGPLAAESPVAPLPVTEVVPGLYVFHGAHEEATAANQGAIANISFIIGTRAVAVIDSGGSAQEGAALRAAIAKVTALPVAYVINTHFHPDHILGDSAFAADKPRIIAHQNFPAALAARAAGYLSEAKAALGPAYAGTQVTRPDHLVSGQDQIDLGNRVLTLTAWPTAHTDADLTVFDQQSATLLAGDLVFIERIPAIDGSITGWLKVITALKAIPAVRVVPGHGPITAPWPAALTDEERYLTLIARETRAALAAGRSLQDTVARAGQSERGRWLLFDDYNPRNVATAYTELEWE